jgi:glycosyltransferase involved in cell wall biosynthesis
MGLSIVHIAAPARFGGLETVLQALLPAQQRMAHEVCFAPVLAPEEAHSHPVVHGLAGRGVTVRPIISGARAYLAERRQVAQVLGDIDADVCHTHGYRPDVVDAPVARRLGIPTVTTVHGYTGGGWKNRVYERMQTRSFRHFDAVVAVSGRLRSDLIARGVPDQRITVIPNGWEPANDILPSDDARKALGLDPSAPHIGWVGRLSPEKGPDVLLRAIPKIEPHTLRVSFLGDGPMRPECVELAERLGVGERISWHGPGPGASQLLRAFDAIVLSSWTEGTPMILLEAMAAGVPVVATAVGGIPDVVSAREANLCEPGDEAGIAAAINDIVQHPVEARRRSGRARERLAEDFAITAWATRYQGLYADLVGGR